MLDNPANPLGTAMPPLSRTESDPIAAAVGLLSTVLHCKKQAAALQRCHQKGEPCTREEAAFVTCSTEHLPLVIGHLVKIADRYCTAEIDELQRCRTLNPGSDCEVQDMACMRCAALQVLRSAQAPASSGS